MTITNFDRAVNRRGILETNLSIIEATIRAHTTTPIDEAQCDDFLQQVVQLAIDLQDNHQNLLNTSPADPDPHVAEYVRVLTKINISKTFLLRLKKTFTPAATASSSHTCGSGRTPANLKLPKLEIPKFRGNYESWQSFQDLFQATVTKNTSISDAEKLSYLKSYVEDEAAQLIKSFTITDQHFTEAWDLLDKRYNNKREIITSHIKRFINQKPVKSENANDLQLLISTTNECLRSLRVLGREVDKWDDLIIVILVDKMDPISRAEWAKHLKTADPPTYKELENFLNLHIRSLLARGAVNSTGLVQSKVSQQGRGNRQSHHVHSQQQSKCVVCNEEHAIYNCSQFLGKSIKERKQLVQQRGLCFTCLRGHYSRDCKSTGRCKKCGKAHNTLLHEDKQNSASSCPQQTENSRQQPSSATNANMCNSMKKSKVLLKTVRVLVQDMMGVQHEIRAMMDDGAESSFITEQCASSLGLHRHSEYVQIGGIGNSSAGAAKQAVNLVVQSRISNASVPVHALILHKVTCDLPTFSCDNSNWEDINKLNLADPYYYQPGQVDMLLGAEITSIVVRSGLIVGKAGIPTATNTIFGWVLSGEVGSTSSHQISVNHASVENSTDQILTKFWEIEELPQQQHLTEEEAKCEEHFQNNHWIENNRYFVKLPFNDKKEQLGDTLPQAIAQFLHLEQRFRRNPRLKEEYSKVIMEYLDLCHMELVPDDEIDTKFCNYVPHHCVFKEDSTTTKIRIVFNGSAKSTTGLSLNDILLNGPVCQNDLFNIIVRFRIHLKTLKTDMARMYRNFSVDKADGDYQRIVWRFNEDEPLRHYRLITVTFGVKPSNFLATRTVKQLAIDNKENFPEASEKLQDDSYVDDLMTGDKSTKDITTLYQDLNQLAGKASLELRKWASNDKEFLQQVPEELRETANLHSFDEDGVIKALGIRWSQHEDQFTFSVVPCNTTLLTKRIILSELAKVFDPLGWLSPVTIVAKIMFQQLWKEKVDWDEEPSSSVIAVWESYQEGLKRLVEVGIPRCISFEGAQNFELHGFCDASEKAYSAAIYLRALSLEGAVSVKLVAAKTKVAPVKHVSLPRLELCGALLLSELMAAVRKAIKLECEVYGWTDSTIVLHWLSSHSGRWKQFVANRVQKVQDVMKRKQWNHVRSEDNPADCASRGITTEEFINHSLWWTGPAWLSEPSYSSTSDVEFYESSSEVDLEEKKVQFRAEKKDDIIFYRYSKLLKLKRVYAYMRRFIDFKCKKQELRQGELSVEEIHNAFMILIKQAQHEVFSDEISYLNENKINSHRVQVFVNKRQRKKVNTPISGFRSDSSLVQLNPFIDARGILRVGGRLSKSNEGEDFKHPIILKASHLLTQLIIWEAHWRNQHSGFQATLAFLQQQYWILRGRDAVRHVIRKCVVCRRQRAKVAEQMMGTLPLSRINPTRPFLECGVDYAGPFDLKILPGRGRTTVKGYFAIFVCFVTRAVHLEVVCSLLTEDFISAFKRFAARRGVPAAMHSDQGTTFKGASKEMKARLNSAEFNSTCQQELSVIGTQWYFNVPSAPFQNGLAEAGVKSVKFHLRRVIGRSNLTIHEFTTLLCMIEATLNSRPLCAISSDPTDFSVLTPGHFLVGGPLTAVPEPDLTKVKENRLSRWQLTQQMYQHFWRRWRGEYLTQLQQRFKFQVKRPNLEIGDLVIIKDDNLPPMKWRPGRVVATHPGDDGLVRNVSLKIDKTDKIMQRPVAKLSPLLYCTYDEKPSAVRNNATPPQVHLTM